MHLVEVLFGCKVPDHLQLKNKNHMVYFRQIFLRAFWTIVAITLFRNKRFLINLILERNASKFARFMEKENPCSFFSFFAGLAYVDIDQGIH